MRNLVITPLASVALATDVHPRLNESDSLEEKPRTQVFVDVSCPSHD
jgi:hypothetical protein